MQVSVPNQVAVSDAANLSLHWHQTDELNDARAQLDRAFPWWTQHVITWVSGKALPGQRPVMPLLCTPVAKILVAAMTVGAGLALGVNALLVLA
jgi:hypothetical protein